MKLHAGLPILLCLGLVSLRAEVPLLSVGADIPVFLSLAGTARYDDNVYLEQSNKKSDTIFIITPGVNLHTTGSGASKAEITFTEQLVRYSSETALNGNLANLAGSAGYDNGRSQFGARASYQQMDQSSTSIRSKEEAVRRNMTNAAVNGNFTLAGKTSAGTSFSYDKTDYSKIGYTDSWSWETPLDLYYAVTPKTDVSLGYRFRRSLTEGAVNNSKDHFLNVGARGEFTPKLSGQVRTGFNERRYDRSGNDRGLGLEADLNYAFTPKTVFSLTANKDYRNSAYGNTERVLSVSLNGNFMLSPAWTLFGGLTFENSHYLSGNDRRDHFWVGSVGAGYSLTSNVSADVSYVYRRNHSNVPVNFEGSLVSLSVSVRF